MNDYEKFQLQWMVDHGYSLYETCESENAVGEKIVLFFSDDDGVLNTALYRVRNYDEHRFPQSFENAERMWRDSDEEYYDVVLASLREDGYDIEELPDYEVFNMGV